MGDNFGAVPGARDVLMIQMLAVIFSNGGNEMYEGTEWTQIELNWPKMD